MPEEPSAGAANVDGPEPVFTWVFARTATHIMCCAAWEAFGDWPYMGALRRQIGRRLSRSRAAQPCRRRLLSDVGGAGVEAPRLGRREPVRILETGTARLAEVVRTETNTVLRTARAQPLRIAAASGCAGAMRDAPRESWGESFGASWRTNSPSGPEVGWAGARTAAFIMCCAAWDIFGDHAGHNAQPLDSSDEHPWMVERGNHARSLDGPSRACVRACVYVGVCVRACVRARCLTPMIQ